ncbi:GGDEF domain-containing protein [Modestobacter sp. VKM Ac-2985]|uniref:GGDEF domain-containing protein n=1 Tax=Modestobacter sp. VKM Ac-2985 TaxID=3004139 RepID=UPI0022AB6CAE|nr:GGDEF domain-containing protein [Modestobacter sp. VKM Ac-2985]MCZ2837986.1 GGDEF domain-containing protein [Modestobacter sp. VKM Ac-2985]
MSAHSSRRAVHTAWQITALTTLPLLASPRSKGRGAARWSTGAAPGRLAAVLPGTAALVLLHRHTRRSRRVIEELERRCRTDALTGLGNRGAFDDDLRDRLQGIVGRRRHADPVGVTLVLADIDHFKSYNDRHGHPAGDRALVRVARALQQACRSGDGVHRIGGEEFAVVLDADHASSLLIADRIRQFVSACTDDRLTVSIGVATAQHDDVEALIGQADRALYRAKSRGRNRIESHRGPHPGLVAPTR